MLPSNEKNIVGKAKPDKTVMSSDDWQAAKEKADISAAGRVVDHIWSDKKTEQLRASLKDPDNVVFITQPSTSGTNVVPVVLAQKLSAEFKTDYIIGDNYFDALHRQQSKHIPQYRRAFDRREYETVDIESLKERIGGKQVILVEDVLTTGGSVADFTHHLQTEDIKVESVTALMGDKRLQIDSKTLDKLDQAIKNKSLPISTPELSQHITRAEAGGLIMAINSARSENAREKLTRNIQGLLDKRIVEDLGRNQIPGGYDTNKGPDKGDASIAERVQPWTVQSKSGLIPYESQKDNFLSSLDKQDKQKNLEQEKSKAVVKNIAKGFGL